MKKLLVLAALALNFVAFSQTENKCDSISLATAEAVKRSEPCVTKAADYLLSQPLNNGNESKKQVTAFILMWMEKAEYTFTLNADMVGLFKSDNEELIGIYMATLAKAAIEFKKDFDKEALKLMVKYIENPDSGVKKTSKIKKFVKDCNDNKFEKYIK